MNLCPNYTASHEDALTMELRRSTWTPWKYLTCGCDHTKLCRPHATIRGAEHYDPFLIPG